MPEYVVQQGDTVASVALSVGIPSAVIWDDPKNKTNLRENSTEAKKRPDPNLLHPLDKLEIPDNTQKTDSGAATSKKHVYDLGSETIKLEVRLLDGNHKPHANKKVEVKIDGTATTTAGPANKCSGTTDGDGVVKVEKVAPDAKIATFSYTGRTVELKIGWLDPIETKSGVIGRLQNLGYLREELTADVLSFEDTDEKYKAAVRGFQSQYVYTSKADEDKVTGVVDSATRSKLKEVHGC